jgi:XapX domain-containing protein
MTDVRSYLLSFAVGLLIGVVYSLLNVRSPAPPIIALVGLLGILIGEQLPPLLKRLAVGKPVTVAWVKTECAVHVLGPLPGRGATIRNCPERSS